jgi:hypothetical protein
LKSFIETYCSLSMRASSDTPEEEAVHPATTVRALPLRAGRRRVEDEIHVFECSCGVPRQRSYVICAAGTGTCVLIRFHR